MNESIHPASQPSPSSGTPPTSSAIPEISTSQTPLMGNTSVEPVTVKESDFLSNTNTAEKDALYQDLFRKNADGEIITGKKPKKS